MCSLQHFYPQSHHLDIGLGFATQSSKFLYQRVINDFASDQLLSEGALPPTTLFPPVDGPYQLCSGGGGFAPYYTFPFGQQA